MTQCSPKNSVNLQELTAKHMVLKAAWNKEKIHVGNFSHDCKSHTVEDSREHSGIERALKEDLFPNAVEKYAPVRRKHAKTWGPGQGATDDCANREDLERPLWLPLLLTLTCLRKREAGKVGLSTACIGSTQLSESDRQSWSFIDEHVSFWRHALEKNSTCYLTEFTQSKGPLVYVTIHPNNINKGGLILVSETTN